MMNIVNQINNCNFVLVISKQEIKDLVYLYFCKIEFSSLKNLFVILLINTICLYFLAVMPPQEQQQNIMSTIQSINSNTLFNNELASNGAAGGANTLTSSESLNNITGGMSPTPNLFETKFNYVTLNTTTPAQIMSMIVINSQVNIYLTICFFFLSMYAYILLL